MKLNQLFATSALILTFSTAAFADMKEDKAAVESSCVQEAVTAKCGQDKVGTGLLKCLHAYKKQNKDFKFGEACKSSMKKLHQDRKEKKEQKK